MIEDNGKYVSWKVYVDRVIEEKEKSLEVRFKLMEDQSKLIATNIGTRVEHLNELREEYTKDRVHDQQLFLTKEQYMAAHEGLAERINKLEKWQAKAIGVGAGLAFASGIAGAVISHLFGKG